MRPLRELLGDADAAHLHRILGAQEDPRQQETRRRSRVSQLATECTFLSEEAVEPFRALSQNDRERLLSDLVWRLACLVEGSSREEGEDVTMLECGFRMRLLQEGGRSVFCLALGS